MLIAWLHARPTSNLLSWSAAKSMPSPLYDSQGVTALPPIHCPHAAAHGLMAIIVTAPLRHRELFPRKMAPRDVRKFRGFDNGAVARLKMGLCPGGHLDGPTYCLHVGSHACLRCAAAGNFTTVHKSLRSEADSREYLFRLS